MQYYVRAYLDKVTRNYLMRMEKQANFLRSVIYWLRFQSKSPFSECHDDCHASYYTDKWNSPGHRVPIKLFWSPCGANSRTPALFGASASASAVAKAGEKRGGSTERTGRTDERTMRGMSRGCTIYTTAPIECRSLKTLDVKRKGSAGCTEDVLQTPFRGHSRGGVENPVGRRCRDFLDIASI